uniref:Uncharacterized protein n=1 Tax=Caenorhabditis japonica TaxID=281687 RepID=A0A8R1IJF2_CAEJA
MKGGPSNTVFTVLICDFCIQMNLEQEPKESREAAELRTVAEKLAAEAVRRKCGDNVSVIIVKLCVIEVP